MSYLRLIRFRQCSFGRGILWCAAAVALASGPTGRAEPPEAEPYLVYVAQEAAHARCGPSGDHYRTDPLRHGQRLEVYVETSDGWLGIRPPDESFSWVTADAVEMLPGGDRATVIEDRTVSWIGTHLGRARRYRWQVQMAAGETVTILGRSERDGPDGPQLWYRVVPPSGEFRWVHRDQVVESAEELVRQAGDSGGDEIAFLPSGPRRETGGVSRGRDASGRQPAIARADHEQAIRRPDRSEVAQPVSANGPSGEDAWPSHAADATVVGSGLRDLGGADAGGLGFRTLSPPSLRDIGQADPGIGQPGHGGAHAPPRDVIAADDGNWVSGEERGGERWHGSAVLGAAAPAGDRAVHLESGDASPAFAVRHASGDGVSSPGMTPGSSPQDGRPSPADLTPILRSLSAISGADRADPSSMSRTTEVPLLSSLRTVSAESIADVERQTRDATVEQLQILFSRLVADRVSAPEVAPIGKAAARLAAEGHDPVPAGRARLLAERVDQYRRIAERRDGDALIHTASTPTIPSDRQYSANIQGSETVQASEMARGGGGLAGRASSALVETAAHGEPAADALRRSAGRAGGGGGGEGVEEQGTLIAVYSIHRDSPPFVLIDRTGQTLAYVTPEPGVDLRGHLNSRIRVVGRRGYREGANTPHLWVSAAERTADRH